MKSSRNWKHNEINESSEHWICGLTIYKEIISSDFKTHVDLVSLVEYVLKKIELKKKENRIEKKFLNCFQWSCGRW